MPDLIIQLEEIGKTLTEIESLREKLTEERDKLTEERLVFRESIVRKETQSREIAQTIGKVSNDLRSIHPPSDEWAETDSEKIEGEDWKDIFQVIDRLNSRCKEAYRKLQSSL